MKKLTFSIVAICCATMLSAQVRHDYNWVLGYDQDLSVPGGEGTLVRFGEGEVHFDFIMNDAEMSGTNTTISDAGGNLLFYTNGCAVLNAQHGEMENGDGLNPGSLHDSFCPDGYPSFQGCLALPPWGGDSTYSLLCLASSDGVWSIADDLLLTTIDMSANGGLGAVVEKNVPVAMDSMWFCYLTAVRHSNNIDWWVLVQHGYELGKYRRLLADSSGITEVGEQEFELPGVPTDFGQMVFSPDGTKYAHFSRDAQVQLHPFDRSTGLLGEPEELFVHDTIFPGGGAAFSPDGRFLYISNTTTLYQYDTWADDIQGSRELIGEWDGFASPFGTTFSKMQLAPDCRIYMITGPGTDYIHVIDHPDRKGAECGFRQHAIQLPSYNFHTIPNHPNYRLGTPYPVCDSSIALITSTVRVGPPPEAGVRVWPNPASGTVNLGLPRPPTATAGWRLYSGTGALVREAVLPAGQNIHRMDVSGLPGGLYYWELRGGDGEVGGGKLVLE